LARFLDEALTDKLDSRPFCSCANQRRNGTNQYPASLQRRYRHLTNKRPPGLSVLQNLFHLIALYLRLPLDLFTGTAGVPPAYEHRKVRVLAKWSMSDVLFALRAHCGRAARGPSKELAWSSASNYMVFSIN
jgi:hypothetical protein